MDFVTHSLVGVGFARLVCPRKDALPQLAIAAVLGSTLMDGDSSLALAGQNFYGRYHRVITHSLLGLSVMVLLAVGISHALALPSQWRKFGWFVSPNLAKESEYPAIVPMRWLLGVAALAALWHWIGDWITSFGNMTPFWPWYEHDVSLRAVNSFEPVIFGTTLVWHIATRTLDWSRPRESALAVVWFLICAGFVLWRLHFGPPGFW